MSNKANNRIISEEVETKIRGVIYRRITFANGETILKTYNDKHRIWITLKFAKLEEHEVIKSIQNNAVDILLGKYNLTS